MALRQLDLIHQTAQARLQRATGASVAGVLQAVPIGADTDEIRTAYATTVSRVVSGGQRQAARLAAAYIGTYYEPDDLDLDAALEDDLVTADSDGAIVGLLRMWALIGAGMDIDQAREEAGTFAGGLAEMQVSDARRDGLDEATRAADVSERWAKVPGPGACDWCLERADDGYRYLSAESVPKHGPPAGGPCACGEAPQLELFDRTYRT